MSNELKIKQAALMQFNGEDFFTLIGDDKEPIYYEGTEEDAKEQYEEEKKEFEDENTEEDFMDFDTWAAENCTEIDDYDEKGNYLVLTDEEANEKAGEYIKDSLWAFNAGFIIEHSKLPWDAKEMVESYQNDKCEGANETIEALIDDIDEFIEDAISADGRGHFMSTYDGRENEETIDGETFYIYRIN